MLDPLLTDPVNGDYTLQANSPAIGYGCQTFDTGKQYTSEIKHKRDLTPDDRTTLSGTISESLLLTSLDIQVTDNVLIENGVTLAFSPGANISFNEFYHIDVQGTLLAQGNADERITFTAADPYLFTYDNDLAGCWNGFKYNQTNDSNQASLFQYAIFEYAKALANQQSSFTDAGAVFNVYDFDKIRIENSIFRYNYANYGSVLALNKDSNISFINNQVNDNKAELGGSFALISYSNPRIINNTICNNEVLNTDDFHSTGIIETYISKAIIYNNIIYQNIDNFFMDNQLFSAKAYHTRFNALDFSFGLNNIFVNELAFEIDDNGIYNFSLNPEIINSATSDIPYQLQVPQLDIMGNSRFFNGGLDLGPLELQALSNETDSQASLTDMLLYPNPFNPEVTLKLPIDSNNNQLIIYNIKGQIVKTYHNIDQEKIVWDGRNQRQTRVASGIYFFKYKSDKQEVIKKALLLK
jgi:hypothetical protein